MATEHRTDLIPGPPIQTRIYPLLIAAGFAIVLSALGVAAVLATVASDVFDNSFAERAAAAAGDPLLARQGDLATFPLWVQPRRQAATSGTQSTAIRGGRQARGALIPP